MSQIHSRQNLRIRRNINIYIYDQIILTRYRIDHEESKDDNEEEKFSYALYITTAYWLHILHQ